MAHEKPEPMNLPMSSDTYEILTLKYAELTQRKRAQSMRLFMEEVAPRLAHLDPDREPALAR